MRSQLFFAEFSIFAKLSLTAWPLNLCWRTVAAVLTRSPKKPPMHRSKSVSSLYFTLFVPLKVWTIQRQVHGQGKCQQNFFFRVLDGVVARKRGTVKLLILLKTLSRQFLDSVFRKKQKMFVCSMKFRFFLVSNKVVCRNEAQLACRCASSHRKGPSGFRRSACLRARRELDSVMLCACHARPMCIFLCQLASLLCF